MLPALLALIPLLVAQESKPVPPTPFDRVLELEIRADDEPAIEGHGPTVFAEYEVEFEGALHVWATSELDLFLQVDDAAEARPLASDDNSGGGTTPFLRIDVEPGDWLVVLVAGYPESTGPLTLHLIAAPETEAGRLAATAARDALRDTTRLVDEGQRAEAWELMAEALPGVMDAAGSDHPDLLEARFKLANWMDQVGDYGTARILDRSVLTGYERILPADHPNLLSVRSNVASSMLEMGDLTGARALMESLVAAYERNLPSDHPDLLSIRANLATSMYEMGDLADARATYESVIAGYERSVPDDHPELLRARANLASSMFVMGDLAESRGILESVHAVYERSLPAHDSDLLRTRGSLASVLHAMGDLAGARALSESVLAVTERTLPEDHPALSHARSSLAISMDSMGDHEGARALRETVLAVAERSLASDHPSLLIAQSGLASSMEAMGDHAGARGLRESVLESYERTLPADHPDLLAARLNLANSLHRMADVAGARALYESVLAASERTLPADHPSVLNARTNLATSLDAMGEFAGARALNESVLASRERSLPADHPDLLSARSDLAISMDAMGDRAGARAHVPKLIEGMRMRILSSLALSPRQARQTVSGESERHSEVLFYSESAGVELKRSVFGLTETMRLVAAEAARSLTSHARDRELAPILAQAAEVRRELNDLVAGALREDAGGSAYSADLTRLSLQRDRLERVVSQRLAERGVETRPIESESLAAALTPGDVAVGFRRIAQWYVDEASGRTCIGADHLMAHVLTADGSLDRIDLGPASDLEDLSSAWRAALGAPIRRYGSLSDAGTPVADASRGIATDAVAGGNVTESAELVAGRALRNRILDPVLAVVTTDVNRFFVCADDLLFLLPLDALPLDAKTQEDIRVGDRIQVVNGVSFARLLAPQATKVGEPSLLSVGGVDYDADGAVTEDLLAVSAPIESDTISDGGDRVARTASEERFQSLAQALHEAEATASLFEEAFDKAPALLTRKKSTKAALYEFAPGKRYLHLATHGWFAPESIRSTADSQPNRKSITRMGIEERVSGLAPMTLCGLALAGANNGRDSLGRVPGILTAEELCSLDLSQCELAVLSACETNVGIRRAGQGIQSLQSALYAAGARTSITSLWKVDDAATRRLMEVFYTNLWIEEMGKAEALWQAKQALRDEGHPPAHWAGWVLTGDPN